MVAAVALIFRRAQDSDLESGMRLLIAQAVEEGFVVRGVVDDQDLDAFLVQRGRDAAQHFLDRRLGIVGDDEDQDALPVQIKKRNGTHAPFLKLKTGHLPG